MLAEAPAMLTDSGAIAAALLSIGALCTLLWQVSKRTIATAVRPMLDEVRAASKKHHDEQNAVIAAGNVAITTGFATVNARLDRGSERMDHLADRVNRLETREEAAVRTVGIVEAVHEAGAA